LNSSQYLIVILIVIINLLRMSAKLTLSIEEEVIEIAKQYAKKQGRSLSNIVEEYLKSIAE